MNTIFSTGTTGIQKICGTMIAKASASPTTKTTAAPTSLFNAYPCIKEVTHKYNRAN